MTELQQTQLVNVNISDFLVMQLLMNYPGLIIWLFGLIYLLFFRAAREHRILGYIFLIILITLILLSGKHYYTLGIYSVLFAAGGYALERYLKGRWVFVNILIIGLMIFSAIPIIPYSLPILGLDKMVKYGEKSVESGMDDVLRWEDGEIHQLPQDYADMTGWKEMVDIVYKIFNQLTEEEKARTIIYTNNYGEAGALTYYGKKLDLPEIYCFNESFIFWTPDELPEDVIVIYVGDSDSLDELFNAVRQVGTLSNIYAREYGLPVYLCKEPTEELFNRWTTRVKELKDMYN
jgi:hypothetical protein